MCSCFGSFTPVFAVETVGMVASEEIGLLSELGIIYAPEDEMEYLDVVTRADFAVYVASMLNLNEYDLRDTRYYTDVPMDHWGLSAINGLTEMGVINGYMGEFNPDEPVTVDQAVKILAKVLGYDTGEEFPIIDNSQLKTLRRNLLEGVENTSGKVA